MERPAVPEAIDVHGHSVPQAFLEEVVRVQPFGVLAEKTDGRYFLTFPGQKKLRPVAGNMLDTTDRAAWLAHQDIGHQIVAPWLDIHGQELPPTQGAQWVANLNDAVAASVADSAGRHSGHATLHLADGDAAAEELRRAVTELGMSSTMIPTSLSDGTRLADPRFEPLWSAAAELDAAVVVHPPTTGPSHDLVAQFPTLRTLYGRQIEATLVIAEMIVAGVFDRHPGLHVVVVHGGGFLPYQGPRFDSIVGALDSGRMPSELVATVYYDTVLMSGPALRFVAEELGSSQIVLGSDYGASPAEQPGPPQTLGPREAFGGTPILDDVLAGNARRLFHLA